MDSEGFTLDGDRSIHSPLLFLLANTLPNNLLDFRVLDLVVAGWLHSLDSEKKNRTKASKLVLMSLSCYFLIKEKEVSAEFSLNIGLFQPKSHKSFIRRVGA